VFSSYSLSGLVLGPYACVLIQIFRVDLSFKSDHSYDLLFPFKRPDRSWWGLLPLRSPSPFYTPHGSLLEDKEANGAFVNSGTHQIPLFNGLPPRALLQEGESGDPMEMLLRKLVKQTADLPSHACFSCSPLPFPMSLFSKGDRKGKVDEEQEEAEEEEEVVLSESGASAIIRIQERSLWRFLNEHIKVNGTLLPKTETLRQVVFTQLQPLQQQRLFQYEPLKHLSETPMKDLIPKRFVEESYLLTEAMSIKLQRDLQEEIDSALL
jgi:hypothetical protein